MDRRGTAPAAGVLLLALLACGGTKQEPETPEPPPTEEVTAPSGQKGFVVQCEDPADCVKVAGNKCPKAYDMKPIGESGSTTEGTERGGALLVNTAAGPMAVGASQGESKTTTTKKFLVECKAEASGGIGSPCQTADNCVRLRVGLREHGLGNAVCARDLAGKRACSFPCAADDDDVTSRLEKLCAQLGKKCLPTGSDETEPPYCVAE